MNDYYGGLEKQCAQGILTASEVNVSLEDQLQYRRQGLARQLASVDEALAQLKLHPEVQDVLEALKKAQQGY
jgi:uncharacterized membrane protein YfbV (UPF0208 family)